MLKKNVKRTFACLLTATMLVGNVAPAYAAEPEAGIVVSEKKTIWVNEGTEEKPDWKFYEDGEQGEAIQIKVTSETTEPTCVTDGKIVWTAKYEGNPTKELILSALGHTAAEAVKEKEAEATCTEDGSYDEVVYCATCGEELSRNTVKTDDKLGHTPAEAVKENEVASTCTKEGSYDEVVYCATCREELSRETKTVEKIPHAFNTYFTKDATCTEAGYGYVECTECGTKDKIEIPAKGHKEETKRENEVEATCTEDGSYEEVTYCTECGEELGRETKTVEKLGHAYEVTGTLKEATCTEEGIGTYKCTRCGDVKEDSIPKSAHTFGDAEEDTEARVEPTCETDGSKVMVSKCSVCGEENRETVILDKLGHEEAEAVKENVVKPTCTEDGSYDAVVYCATCEKELSRETVTVDKLGHTAAEAAKENEVAATCTTKGSYDKVVRCSVCNEVLSTEHFETEIVPEKHDYQVVKVVEEPTCTKKGTGYYECSLCHDKKAKAEEIPALGHKEAEVVIEKEVAATCTEDGSYDEVVYCATCREELSRETKTVDKLGHSFENTEEKPEYVSKEPACEETGLGYYICKTCGEKSTNIKIPAKGHTLVTVKENYQGSGDCHEPMMSVVAKLLSLVTNDNSIGSYDEVEKCSVCRKELSRTTVQIKAQDHVYAADDVKFLFDENNSLSGVAVFQCTNTVEGLGKRCKKTHRIMFTVDPETAECVVDKDATCTEEGLKHYVVSVAYAGVTAKANTPAITIPPTGHDLDVRIVDSDVEGFYDVETYCKVCEEVINKQSKLISSSNAVIEDKVDPDCETEGSYNLVITDESGATKIVPNTIPATGHIERTVKENVVPATCEKDGSYDEVVYCAICKKELSRETKVGEPALGHTAAEAVTENAHAATCTEDGSYDKVVYCATCGEEMSRETVKVDKLGHTAAEEVIENEVAATCTKDGSYDKVVYCATCGEEMSRETVKVEKHGHNPGKAVYENIKEATATTSRTYDSVVYCKTCHEKLSSKKITVAKAANTVRVCGCNNKKLYASKLKKTAQSFNIHTYINDKAKLTYKKTKGSKYITVSSAGKLTVKKGTKKGTYKVTVQVKSAQTKLYKSASTTKTIVITVK